MIVRPRSTSQVLHDQALKRPLIDYEATRRAVVERETKLQYKDWRNVGDSGNPGFGAGWSNLDPVAASAFEPLTSDGRNPLGFYRDRWGFVHIRGVVQNTSGMSLTTIFALPSDLRPSKFEYFRSEYVSNGTGGLSGTAFRWACLISIDSTTGDVKVAQYYTTTTTGGVRLLSLEDIAFHAADRGAV